ncbi:MAG: tape measure protein [Desulfitobacterium sp.]
MFQLYDGYTKTISKVNKSTDNATNKILKASGATDSFNKKLRDTGAGASSASSGVMRLVSAAALLAGSLKGMNIADEFTNTAARLKLINDGLQTQAELQDKIFASANRSRGLYSSMANAVAKLGMLAGDAFGSNDELIAFTELMQKSFRLSGASPQEQSAGMYQLTQAMAAGKLQGDEFRSIMENAPMLAQAIATYTGKSKGELKEMSSEGTITADIIKNAMFMAGEDINTMFETLPITFADIGNRIKNDALKAFEPVIKRINAMLNSQQYEDFINRVSGAINTLAIGIDSLGGFVQANWGIIEPIMYAFMAMLALITFGYLPAMLVQWLIMQWPIMLVGAAIGLLIYLMVKYGDTTSKVFGFIGGGIGVLLGLIYNMAAAIANSVLYLGDFVVNFFVGLINSVLGLIDLAVAGLNKLPGVEIDAVGQIEYVNTKKDEFVDLGAAWSKGQDIGQSFGGSLSGLGDKLAGYTPNVGAGVDLSSYMVNGAMPITGVDGGKIEVEMSEEDLKYLRDIAERDYINKFSTATLAPNIQVTFGDVHEEADADKVAGRLRRILREEIATAAEGDY